jgi:hypothetical protein
MPKAWRLMPVISMSRKNPPASASDNRLEIVMVKRSLDAAKAIKAGKSKSLITSVVMITRSLDATHVCFNVDDYALRAG